MNSTGRVFFNVLFVISILASGCAPSTFIRTSLGEWRVVEVREGLSREQLWQNVADIVAKSYDIEVIDKDSGYIRTAWMFTTTGKVNEQYRARVIIKISPLADKIEIKTDAHWYDRWRESWIMGQDTALMEQVYGDIQGTVGRVIK